MSFDSQYATSY